MNFYSNYRFTLDIQKSKSQVSIPVHYGDTGNRFYITFTDGGNPYIIPEGCRADIYIKKPEPHKPLVNACIIENNALIRYEFNTHTASVEGMHKCELRLYSADGRIITSPSFVMVVDERVVYDDEIGSPEDFDRLIALDVIANEENRIESEYLRSENEKDRQAAETARVYAENARDVAEAMRKETEAARVDAENARVSAENARVSAENDRGQELAVLKPYVETHIPNHETRISANETSISDHEERISGIEQYLGGDNFIVDDSIAYQKAVPKNACEKAKVLSVGGMTYKSKNLIPYPHLNSTRTLNGLTFTDNKDGTVTIKGTATEMTGYVLSRELPLRHGVTYTISGSPISVSNGNVYVSLIDENGTTAYKWGTFTWDNRYTFGQVYIQINANVTVDATFRPMVEEGTVATAYEPYFPGLRHAKVEAIESAGRNIINPSEYIAGAVNTTLNGDVITFSPTSGSLFINRQKNITYPKGEYTLLIKPINGVVYCGVFVYPKSDTTFTATYAKYLKTDADFRFSFTMNEDFAISIGGYVEYGTYSFKIQLSRGSNELPYARYVSAIDTFTIPEAVQARCEGYGYGVDIFSNTIDLEHKSYVKCANKIVFTGTENWNVWSDETASLFYIDGLLPGISPLKGVCSHCDYREIDNRNILLIGTYVYTTGIIRMRLSFNHSTVEEFKAYLAEQYASGTPVTIVYGVEKTVTDISDLLTSNNYIEVEAGGTITAVNEHKLAAPSSIKYLVTYPKEV